MAFGGLKDLYLAQFSRVRKSLHRTFLETIRHINLGSLVASGLGPRLALIYLQESKFGAGPLGIARVNATRKRVIQDRIVLAASINAGKIVHVRGTGRMYLEPFMIAGSHSFEFLPFLTSTSSHF